MTRERSCRLNAGEAMILRQTIVSLNEHATKQALGGLVGELSQNSSISSKAFKEILDDAAKYSKTLKQP